MCKRIYTYPTYHFMYNKNAWSIEDRALRCLGGAWVNGMPHPNNKIRLYKSVCVQRKSVCLYFLNIYGAPCVWWCELSVCVYLVLFKKVHDRSIKFLDKVNQKCQYEYTRCTGRSAFQSACFSPLYACASIHLRPYGFRLVI